MSDTPTFDKFMHDSFVEVVPRLCDEITRLKAALAQSDHELERWRHGEMIEGDYVCPDSLELTAARATIARGRGLADAVEALLYSATFAARWPEACQRLLTLVTEFRASANDTITESTT